MIRKERPDVVDIVVPHDFHHVVASVVMEEGINVICETPIAPTLMLADYMINKARKAGVKAEIAENYFRAPTERLKHKVLDMGLIGEVIRTYCVNAGGGHGMSHLRLYSRGEATSIVSFAKRSVVPSVKGRMGRLHTSDMWALSLIDFDNGVQGVYEYSNLAHARAIGRGSIVRLEIDGTKGSILNDDVYTTKDDDRLKGGQAIRYPMRSFMSKIEGVEVLDRVEIDTSPKVVWQNAFKDLPISQELICVVDELNSIAEAVANDTEPEYGARQARKDLELDVASVVSSARGSVKIRLPLTSETEVERKIHEDFEEKYGCKPLEIDKLLQVFFPAEIPLFRGVMG